MINNIDRSPSKRDIPNKDRLLIIDMLHPELLPRLETQAERNDLLLKRADNLRKGLTDTNIPIDIYTVTDTASGLKNMLGIPDEDHCKQQATKALTDAIHEGYDSKHTVFITACQTSAPTWHAINDAAKNDIPVAGVISESVMLSSECFLKHQENNIRSPSLWDRTLAAASQGFMSAFQPGSLDVEKQFSEGVAAPLLLAWAEKDPVDPQKDRMSIINTMRGDNNERDVAGVTCDQVNEAEDDITHNTLGHNSPEFSEKIAAFIKKQEIIGGKKTFGHIPSDLASTRERNTKKTWATEKLEPSAAGGSLTRGGRGK